MIASTPSSVTASRSADMSPEYIRVNHYRAGLRQGTHHHHHPTVSLLFRGSLRETARRTEEPVEGLALVVKPAGTRHSDDFGPTGASLLQINLPGSAHDDAELHAGLRQWRWIRGGAPLLAAVELLRTVALSGPGESGALDAAREVLATLGPAAPAAAPGWLPEVAEYLREAVRQGRQPRVPDAAAVAAIHPVHLTRVFRRQFGCTVSAYIRRLRVQQAARLLAGQQPLARIAAHAGFADQSHCTREFRRETRLRPAEYRALITGPRLSLF